MVSTPYNGDQKNVALAATGKLDRHFSALWDGGHIKFFSIATLRQLPLESGFLEPRFIRIGYSAISESMMAVAAGMKLPMTILASKFAPAPKTA